MLGGYTGTPHQYNRAEQSTTFQRISLYDAALSQALPHRHAMQSATIEAHNDRIIRIGGLVAADDAGETQDLKSLASVEAFDLTTRTWTALPSMPAGRSSHDTIVMEDTLYVVGGWTLDDRAGIRMWRDDMWTLDLSEPKSGWKTVKTPFKRRAIAVEAIAGHLVIIGGMTPDFEQSSRLDLYNPETDSWSRGPDFPRGAFGVAATRAGDRIVASSASGEVFAWTDGDDRWSHVATLTFPRFFHQLAPTPGGDVIAIGGISSGKRPRHIERIHLDAATSGAPAVHEWVVPYPGEAKNRQGAFVHNGELHVFGGNNSVGQHDFEPENFLAEGWTLDLGRLEWTPMAPYPAKRQSMSTIVRADGTGVSIGGFGHDGDAARTQRDGFTFDFKTSEWSVSARGLPVSRSQFGLAEHNGRLWVFGGLDYDPKRDEGDQFRHLTDVLVEERSDSAATFVPSDVELPRPRRAFGNATLDERFYLVGGMRDGFQLVETCDVFDFDTQTWSTIASPQRVRLNPELVSLGGRLFLAGGSSPRLDGADGLAPNPTIEMYDPASDTWTVVIDELPMPARHLLMDTFRGRLLLYSVHNSEQDAARIALIDVRSFLRSADDDSSQASVQR